MNKIIASREYNNGYGCSCCASSWKNYEWVDRDKYTKIVILELALSERRKMSDSHLVKFMLEDNGEKLFGFECEVYRAGENLYWVNEEGTRTMVASSAKGDRKIQIKTAIKRLGSNF